MNRVLNVIIISGLACTLACAPGSRHQQTPSAPNNNKGVRPGATPSGTPSPGQGLGDSSTKADATTKIVANPKFDPTSVSSITADVFRDSSGGMTIKFAVLDSKNQTQEGKIAVDAKSDITPDSTLTGTYNCEDENNKTVPANCLDSKISFNWNGKSGEIEVLLTQGLKVTEAIAAVPATKSFGTAKVQTLTLNWNSLSFSKTMALIYSADTTPSADLKYDDKQSGSGDEANISIKVFGLPKVALDGTTAIRPAETLSTSGPGRVSPGTSLTIKDKGNQLVYTLGVQPDAGTVQPLTLTISMPSDDDKSATVSDVDKATAKAAADKATADKATADAATAAAAGKPDASGTSSTSRDKNGGAAPDTLSPDGAGATANAGTGGPGKTNTPKNSVADKNNQAKLDQAAKDAKALQDQRDAALKNAGVGQTPVVVAPVAPATAPVVSGVSKVCVFQSAVMPNQISPLWETVHQQEVDFVNGQASIKLNNLMKGDGWINNSCDSSTGRVAVTSQSPGAVPCISKSREVDDGVDHDETIIFRPTGGQKDEQCGATIYHYTTGNYNTVDGKTACVVNNLDGMKMTAAFDKSTDGHNAHITAGAKDLYRNYPMTDMAGYPGQYEHVAGTIQLTKLAKYNMLYDVFNQPDGTKNIWQCWGRVSRDFTSASK